MVALFVGAAGLIQEHAAEASGGPLTVEGGLMVWTVVVFLLLLLVLKRFAWPAILGAVEAREQALEAQLAQAAKDREEAAALLAEHKRLVADARHQATGIVAEARGVAEKERALAVEKTKQEQDELLARARRRSRPSVTARWPTFGERPWTSRWPRPRSWWEAGSTPRPTGASSASTS
jgi:F-type H+-transporting ATPase subunit b